MCPQYTSYPYSLTFPFVFIITFMMLFFITSRISCLTIYLDTSLYILTCKIKKFVVFELVYAWTLKVRHNLRNKTILVPICQNVHRHCKFQFTRKNWMCFRNQHDTTGTLDVEQLL